VPRDEALINGSAELPAAGVVELLQHAFRTGREPADRTSGQDGGGALEGDWNLSARNRFVVSYNFNHSRKRTKRSTSPPTVRLPTHRRRPGTHQRHQRKSVHDRFRQQAQRASRHLLEGNAPTNGRGVQRESRHRASAPSRASGSAIRFFLQPNIDELIWRVQVKDNFSIVRGRHTGQDGRRLVAHAQRSDLPGLLYGPLSVRQRDGLPSVRVVSGGWGVRSVHSRLFQRRLRHGFRRRVPRAARRPAGPLVFYLQGAGRTGPATDAAGASTISNDEFSLFIQDQWQARPNVTLQYGLRVGCAADARHGRSGPRPRLPSFSTTRDSVGRHDPEPVSMWQPRVGATWDVKGNGRSVLRASAGVYFARQNMLSQVGTITTNGLQQQRRSTGH